MEQREYWNSVSEKKEFTTPFQHAVFSKYVSEESVILDVGCGYGRTLDELWNNGFHNLIGIDFSEGMIDRGKEKYPYLDMRIKHNNTIDLPDESVDAVILFAVLTCICSNGEQKELIKEIKRVLKPGGIIYVNDFLLNTDERNISRYEKYRDVYGAYGVFALEEGAVLRHHSEEWIEELLSSFAKEDYKHLTFTTMNGNVSNGFYYVGRK